MRIVRAALASAGRRRWKALDNSEINNKKKTKNKNKNKNKMNKNKNNAHSQK